MFVMRVGGFGSESHYSGFVIYLFFLRNSQDSLQSALCSIFLITPFLLHSPEKKAHQKNPKKNSSYIVGFCNYQPIQWLDFKKLTTHQFLSVQTFPGGVRECTAGLHGSTYFSKMSQIKCHCSNRALSQNKNHKSAAFGSFVSTRVLTFLAWVGSVSVVFGKAASLTQLKAGVLTISGTFLEQALRCFKRPQHFGRDAAHCQWPKKNKQLNKLLIYLCTDHMAGMSQMGFLWV